MLQLGPVQVEETDDGDVYYVEYFDLVDYNGELKAHVEEEHKFNLYLSKEMEAAWKQFGDKPIPVDKFDDDDDTTILFNIEIKSKSNGQGYTRVTALLDSKDHMGYSENIDGMCQEFAETMLDSGINYNFVHYEMIIRSMMRKKSNELEYPDFGPNGDHKDYIILRLTSSLSKNPSPMVRLSTGWLKKNLISTQLYKAHRPSHLDALFVPVLTDVID